MTQAMRDAILAAIPAGSANAIRQREVWRRAGQVGAESSFGIYKLTASGEVKRRRQPIPSGFAWLYWREA